MAHRLRPIVEEHLRSTQFCGVPGNTILDAVATVREAIAYAEIKKVPLGVLSLDFKNAFDRISHTYLHSIFQCYGLGDPFIDRLKRMYEGATSSVQLNGPIHGPIPTRCAIRQGCPLSILLYALCLHTLLCTLEKKNYLASR